MKKLLTKHAFWTLVIQSGQIALGAAQGITIASDVAHIWNYAMAACQAGLGILTLWTVDKNRNGLIDIVEDTTETTITVSSQGGITVTDVTETKSPEN